jgi:hypothetical protein
MLTLAHGPISVLEVTRSRKSNMVVEDARYDELGSLLVALAPRGATKLVLYVEFDDGVIGPSVFYEHSNTLYYVPEPDDLFPELGRLQVLFGPEVRVLEFVVEDGKFHAAFTYEDQFDQFADRGRREDIVLQRLFGHANASEPDHLEQ